MGRNRGCISAWKVKLVIILDIEAVGRPTIGEFIENLDLLIGFTRPLTLQNPQNIQIFIIIKSL